MDFRSHDAFEAVLRRYGHPAAVADFEALPRGGESRNKFLEALGTACRDSCMQFITQQNMKEKEGHATSHSTVVDKNAHYTWRLSMLERRCDMDMDLNMQAMC
jgi:hypothetical protein